MPTAAEYDEWGRWFSARGDEMSGLLVPALAADSPEVVTGGSLAVSVDVAIRASAANALTAAGQLRELADECARRAQVCRDYDSAMHEYEGRVAEYRSALGEFVQRVEEAETAGGGYPGSPPWPPSEPARPEPWVER
jgi:hypothetical protein